MRLYQKGSPYAKLNGKGRNVWWAGLFFLVAGLMILFIPDRGHFGAAMIACGFYHLMWATTDERLNKEEEDG